MKPKRMIRYIFQKIFLIFILYGMLLGAIFAYDFFQYRGYTTLLESFRSDTLHFNNQLHQMAKWSLQYDYSAFPAAPSFRNVLQGVSIVEKLPLKTMYDYKTTELIFSWSLAHIQAIIRDYPFLEGVVGYKNFLESYDVWLSRYETFLIRWNQIKKQHTYCMLFPWYNVVLRFFPRDFL